MLRFIKCISTIDAACCAFRILDILFKWWNYAQHRWLIEIYYYVIQYGRVSLDAIVPLIFVPLAIDRIRASNRQKEKFAQKYQQITKTNRTIFNIVIAVVVVFGMVCSLPLFYVFKIRQAYYTGESVYTIIYIEPGPRQPCIRPCLRIIQLFSGINLEEFYRVTRFIFPKAVLCMCLITLIFKLPKIIDHYQYTKYKCKQTNQERTTNIEDCESDLSLVPAVLITTVFFSVVICIPSVITYLRFERIIAHPKGITMRKVVNLFLEIPANLACATKPFIYLIFSSRYRNKFGKLIKYVRFWANRSYEPQLGVNQDQGEWPQRYQGTGSMSNKSNGNRENEGDYGARRREEGKTAEGSIGSKRHYCEKSRDPPIHLPEAQL